MDVRTEILALLADRTLVRYDFARRLRVLLGGVSGDRGGCALEAVPLIQAIEIDEELLRSLLEKAAAPPSLQGPLQIPADRLELERQAHDLYAAAQAERRGRLAADAARAKVERAAAELLTALQEERAKVRALQDLARDRDRAEDETAAADARRCIEGRRLALGLGRMIGHFAGLTGRELADRLDVLAAGDPSWRRAVAVADVRGCVLCGPCECALNGWDEEECTICYGRGYVDDPSEDGPCVGCGGSGEVASPAGEDAPEICAACGGSGWGDALPGRCGNPGPCEAGACLSCDVLAEEEGPPWSALLEARLELLAERAPSSAEVIERARSFASSRSIEEEDGEEVDDGIPF